jgi:hypothetical protein
MAFDLDNSHVSSFLEELLLQFCFIAKIENHIYSRSLLLHNRVAVETVAFIDHFVEFLRPLFAISVPEFHSSTLNDTKIIIITSLMYRNIKELT